MRASKITEHENKFASDYVDINGTKFKVSSIESITGGDIIKINPGYSSYFYPAKYTKTKIILHNTVGVLRSDIAALSKKDWHVSVPYVIARNGTIYELFDPTMWSYHLGKGAIGGNKTNSKSSVAIELSSYGPLNRVKDNLETMYSNVTYVDRNGNNKQTGRDVYCTVHEREQFIEVPVPYRGYRYFTGYTDAQLKSLNSLIDYLCERFDIPKQILDENIRYDLFSSSKEAREYTGICSHVNFIGNGKWDIGPEMDWDYLCPKDEPVIIESEPEVNEIEIEDIKIKPEVSIKAESTKVIPKPTKRFSVITFVLNLLKKYIV